MPKINTTLLINYTSILKNSQKRNVNKEMPSMEKLNIDCGLNSSILLMANILILIMIV